MIRSSCLRRAIPAAEVIAQLGPVYLSAPGEAAD